MVSLVHKGANRRQFKIFKSANLPEEEPVLEPDAEQQQYRGLFQVLKEFFTGTRKAEATPVPSFAQAMAAIETEDALWRAFSTLREICTNILSSDAEDKPARINQVVEEFRAYLLGKISQIGFAKAAEQLSVGLEKAGRKISAARLKALKDAHNILAQIIAEAEADNQDGEGTQVTKEELAKMVAEAVNEATKPISERLEKLEKQADGKSEAGQEKDDLQEVIKAAVAEAVKPLEDRLEVVEKARGISNRVPEEKDKVEKSESFWGGVFLG
jgi:DNA-binding protein YbaB